MKLKDRIGNSITNFLFPYINEYYSKKGEIPMSEIDNFYLMERYLWYQGNENDLITFYQGNAPKGLLGVNAKKHYYYAKARNDIRVIHSGIPRLIANTKAKILVTGGIKANVVKPDGNTDKKTTELLHEILEDNKWMDQIAESVKIKTWGGTFAYKLIFDKEITPFPIWEVYQPFNFRINKEKGRVISYVFIEEYEDDRKNNFELHEEYGKGYIKYTLYKIGKTGNMEEVPLSTIPEYADLKDIEWSEPIIMAGALIGESAFTGLTGEFDALDEQWSQMMDEVREGRADKYVPDELLIAGVDDPLRRKHVVLGTDEREGSKNEIKFNQADIRIDTYREAIDLTYANILANVGLSRLTVGMDESIGKNTSGDSIVEREVTTLRTRKALTDEYQAFLEEFFNTLLFAYDFFVKTKMKTKSNARRTDYDVVVTFGDYVKDTKNERIEQAVKMLHADAIDQEKALDEIYGEDLTEEERVRILANIGMLTLDLGDTADEEEDVV